ncbi:angiopoietin-related protein 4-like [Babylonia areolata]|uniref:angiopoietin-related protein 4-like n=1 Tax=Babylonia areolata TaxID=304850 RepID=UPI003FD5DF18
MLWRVSMLALLVVRASAADSVVKTAGSEFHHFVDCGANMVLKAENRYREVSAQSALHCAMLCGADAACRSFDYHPLWERCFLSSVSVGLHCDLYMVPFDPNHYPIPPGFTGGGEVQHYEKGPRCMEGKQLQPDGTCQCPRAFDGPHCKYRMQDCSDWYNFTTSDEVVQWIWPLTSNSPFQVMCDMMMYRARTVLMQRRDGDVGFQGRGWADYSEGFGSLGGDHWLGLRYMHLLTTNRQYQLRFTIKANNSQSPTVYYVMHSDVHIGNESAGFPLSVLPMKGSNNSTLLDCLHPDLLHIPFTTADVDNDLDDTQTCSLLFGGGWWFNGTAGCSVCNPTGRLMVEGGGGGSGAADEVFWATSGGGAVFVVPYSVIMFLVPE